MQTLIKSDWLMQLSKGAQEALMSNVHIRHYDAGQRIYNRDALADGLYCVLDGEVKVSIVTYGGTEIMLTTLRKGQWFGEVAILDEGTRSHDMGACTSARIGFIPKTVILQVCESYPEVYKALAQLVCLHSRQAYEAIASFLSGTPAKRLASQLIAQVDNGSVALKQSELASMVGISRQSVSKILKKWELERIILRRYAKIEILSIQCLKRIAVCIDG